MKVGLLTTIILVLAGVARAGDEALPVIHSNVELVSVRDGEQFRPNAWRLAPEVNPDVYTASLIDGSPHTVTFITDVDSISFMVEVGKEYDFVIQWGDQMCSTRVVGVRFVPAAVFDEAYQEAHRGKIIVEIPEVYELVNVAIALTRLGTETNNFVYQKSPYCRRMKAHFLPFAGHPFVVALDSLFEANSGFYATIKMNARAFEFINHNQIVQSPVYDRTGFRNERTNRLRPYLSRMQSFSDATRFRRFYAENRDFYEGQIAFYRDSVGVDEMRRWLDKNFPGREPYDTYRIVFSPLVSYNQSTTWFESNGFTELQPHVNFPYRADTNPKGTLSNKAERIYRGNILFTELNHGYINPEGDRYRPEIQAATSNRDTWVDPGRPAGYYSGNAAFLEYMNWGLVSLRIVDYVPADEQEQLLNRVVGMMVKARGFLKFKEFNARLVDLYRNRKPGTTVADLYPEIINWFALNN